MKYIKYNDCFTPKLEGRQEYPPSPFLLTMYCKSLPSNREEGIKGGIKGKKKEHLLITHLSQGTYKDVD